MDVLSLAIAPTKNLLAVGDRAGNVTVWDLRTRRIEFQRCSYNYDEPEPSAEGYCELTSGETAEIRGLALRNFSTKVLSRREYEMKISVTFRFLYALAIARAILGTDTAYHCYFIAAEVYTLPPGAKHSILQS